MSKKIEMLVQVTLVSRVTIVANESTARVEVEPPMVSPLISIPDKESVTKDEREDYMRLAVTQLVKLVHNNMQESIKDIGEYAMTSPVRGEA